MNRLLLGTFAALLAVAAPARASAFEVSLGEQPLRLELSEYALVSYHLDNGSIAPPGAPNYDPSGSNYVDWLNRLQADAAWGDFTGLLRLDSALFAHQPQAAPGDVRMERLLAHRYGNRIDPERVALGYTGRHLEVTLGDSYVTFGRGLVLSLRKLDELGIDTAVRGANVTGKVAGLSVTGVGGISNIVNVDPASGRTADDPKDLVFGGRGEYRFGKWVVPGLDFSRVVYAKNFQDALPQDGRDQVTAFSETLELPNLWGYGNAYAEYAQQERRTQDHTQYATGFYASASAYAGPVTVLAEYKDYRHWNPAQTSLDPTQYPELALSDFYTAAPTLERVQQIVLNNSDVAGPRARVDVEVKPWLTPFASMAVFKDRLYQTHIYDPYAGVEVHWQDGRSRASVQGGYRVNRYDEVPETLTQPFQDVWHVSYDVNQVLTGQYSLELDGLSMWHKDQQGPKYNVWREGQSYLSFKRAEHFAVAVGYEYYTEAPVSIRSNYVNFSGTWFAAKWLSLRLFVGGQRAGIKCVNGVCRNYPAFDGGRLEVISRY